MEEPNWGSVSVVDGKLSAYEDNAWQVIDLTDETILRLLSRCINEWSTYREVAPHDIARHNKAMEENSALRAALTVAQADARELDSALEILMGEQNGPPLIRSEARWWAAMDVAKIARQNHAALNPSTATGAGK